MVWRVQLLNRLLFYKIIWYSCTWKGTDMKPALCTTVRKKKRPKIINNVASFLFAKQHSRTATHPIRISLGAQFREQTKV